VTTSSAAPEQKEVRCHDCGRIASSSEEAKADGFCHVRVFDAHRRTVVGGDEEEEDDQQEAAVRQKDGYYWLCPDCFHHMQETLLVVGDDLSDKFSRRYRRDLGKEEERI
jgi:hypothetical protein